LQVRERVRDRNVTLRELFRHFWACFPITGLQQEAKIARICKSVREEHKKLEELRNSLLASRQDALAVLLEPLLHSAQKIFAEFAAWDKRNRGPVIAPLRAATTGVKRPLPQDSSSIPQPSLSRQLPKPPAPGAANVPHVVITPPDDELPITQKRARLQ